jgi:hypothetical protein
MPPVPPGAPPRGAARRTNLAHPFGAPGGAHLHQHETTLKSVNLRIAQSGTKLLFTNHLYFCALFWGVILMSGFKDGADALFILLGAIMILAMHAGFAFLELGTVRKKNQVNALVKILVDFAYRPSPISSSATALPTASISSPRPTCWPPKTAMSWSSSSSC